MSVHLNPEHLEKAQALVKEAHANNGLAPLDLARFWADEEIAGRNPFSHNIPQVPLGIRMSSECLFAELGVTEDWRRFYHDQAWLRSLAKPYNDKAEHIVGRRLLSEKPPTSSDQIWPRPRELYDIFEAENIFHNDSFWLKQKAHSPDELAALLDNVERRLDGNLRDFLLPPEWDREKSRLQKLGVPSPIYRSQRGPVTFAMSIFGTENLIFLILDQPDLAARYRDIICRAILERARILDEERGWRMPVEAVRGWSWFDDNCCLLNKEMYDFFAKPILQAVFARYAPGPNDVRYQHSDSDMAQHLETLGELELTGVNFGPNLTVTQIRQHLPCAVIHGQLAPFTFSRNEEINLVAEVIRDCELARPTRGLCLMTAGSINNGSRLTGLRLIMAAIQKYGCYGS